MIRINNYFIKRCGKRFEVYWEDNEFCRYEEDLVHAVWYVTRMLLPYWSDLPFEFQSKEKDYVSKQLFFDFG